MGKLILWAGVQVANHRARCAYEERRHCYAPLGSKFDLLVLGGTEKSIVEHPNVSQIGLGDRQRLAMRC